MNSHYVTWLFKYTKQIKSMLFIGALLILLKAISSIMLISIQKFIIDDIFMKGNFDKITFILAIFSISILGFNIFHAVAARVFDSSGLKVNRLLTKDLFSVIYKTPTHIIQSKRTGEYLSLFSNDIRNVSNMVSQYIPEGYLQIINLILLSIVIWMANPFILIFLIILSTIYAVLGSYFNKKIKKTSKYKEERRTKLLIRVEEGVTSTREIIAFHREEFEKKQINKLASLYIKASFQGCRINNKQVIYIDTLKWIANLLIICYGGYKVMEGELSLGMFVITYQFSSQLIDSYQGVYKFFVGFNERIVSIERLVKHMEATKVEDGQNCIHSFESLKFIDVNFKYMDSLDNTLKNNNIDIVQGQSIAIVGESGSGKSTIAQLLIRTHEPQSGIITVNNISLSEISRSNWSKITAQVFQETYFFPDSILNNLIVGREGIRTEQVINMCKALNIHDFIESLKDGYNTTLGERGIKLSGGQRQRLAIARAMLGQPELLILDEATSALDYESERDVLNNLTRLRQGKTTIIITHRLKSIIDSDYIYVVESGTIVDQGTHQVLLNSKGLYKKLLEKQAV